MSFAAIKYVVSFLTNYAEENAISLPGDIIKISSFGETSFSIHCKNNMHIMYTQKIWDYYIECC